MAQSKVRYAVVGLGYIAQAAVLPSFAHARRNSSLHAIVSGSVEKLNEIGDKYRIPVRATYDDYDRVLQEVDAVYICTPNSEHEDYVVRAALEHPGHGVLDAHAALQHRVRVLDLAAAGAGEIAGEERLQLDDQRELRAPGELLAQQIGRDGEHLSDRNAHQQDSLRASRRWRPSAIIGKTRR